MIQHRSSLFLLRYVTLHYMALDIKYHNFIYNIYVMDQSNILIVVATVHHHIALSDNLP